MSWRTNTYQREKLYEEVWAEPVSTVAKRYGISGVAIAKKCRPPGNIATGMGVREYAWSEPGMASPIRVTTNPVYYEEHSDSMELWSPGSPVFPAPKEVGGEEGAPLPTATLKDLFQGKRQ